MAKSDFLSMIRRSPKGYELFLKLGQVLLREPIVQKLIISKLMRLQISCLKFRTNKYMLWLLLSFITFLLKDSPDASIFPFKIGETAYVPGLSQCQYDCRTSVPTLQVVFYV